MADSSGSPFRVVFTQEQLRQLRAWSVEAGRLGIRAAFADALKMIQEKLATDPLGWGDPNYRLRRLDLLVCHAVRPPLHVYYGVDEARRLVYIKTLSPTSGSGLVENP